MTDQSRRYRRAHRQRGRGQALVEFAIILPVLLIIVLVGVDFGRLLYGWVVLQNSARIGANYAGFHPEGWRDPQPAVQATYQQLIGADLGGANCTPTTPLPSPVFTDGSDVADPSGNPDTQYDVGDSVAVSLECAFKPLTPIVSGLVGNTFMLGATSNFRVRAGDVTGIANPTRIPALCTVTPEFEMDPPGPIANGTTVEFTDLSTTIGCAITDWDWTFPSGTPATATGDGPHDVVFNVASTQDVTVELVVTTDTADIATFTMTFQVTAP